MLFPVWATRTSEKIGLPNPCKLIASKRTILLKDATSHAGSVSNALLVPSTWFSHILVPYDSSKIFNQSQESVLHCLLEELTLWHPTWSDSSRTSPTHGGSSGSRIEMNWVGNSPMNVSRWRNFHTKSVRLHATPDNSAKFHTASVRFREMVESMQNDAPYPAVCKKTCARQIANGIPYNISLSCCARAALYSF